MEPDRSNEYFLQKMSLLKQYLRLSEELLSEHRQDSEYGELLTKRARILESLEDLEASSERTQTDPCTQKQKSLINQMIRLILGVNNDVERAIRCERDDILKSLEVTTRQQTIAGYSLITMTDSGRRIDCRK